MREGYIAVGLGQAVAHVGGHVGVVGYHMEYQERNPSDVSQRDNREQERPIVGLEIVEALQRQVDEAAGQLLRLLVPARRHERTNRPDLITATWLRK